MMRGIQSILIVLTINLTVQAQEKIVLVSDTQKPMWVEKLFLKYNQNERATRLIFNEIKIQKPTHLYILGDVVNWGPRKKSWDTINAYISSCRQQNIEVSASLGNHDVMGNLLKGELQFQSHFPDHIRTGYIKVVDSTAFVLLNSNFKKLKSKDVNFQNNWLISTLHTLDRDLSIRIIIVACHHAPYTNSKTVGSSLEVQKNFVPPFMASRKARLFVTGHSHAFEHFKKDGKDFLIIGGGGGIHQPLRTSSPAYQDLATDYKPMFHFLTITRQAIGLKITSYQLTKDFRDFKKGYTTLIESGKSFK